MSGVNAGSPWVFNTAAGHKKMHSAYSGRSHRVRSVLAASVVVDVKHHERLVLQGIDLRVDGRAGNTGRRA